MSLSDLIFKNLWLKLISLALATAIWFAIHLDNQNERNRTQPQFNHVVSQELYRLPVSVVTQPGDGRVFQVTPREVDVTAHGEDAVLRSLRRQDFRIYIDLTDFHSQKPTNGILRADAPSGVAVVKINPSVVSVEQISP